MRDQEILGLHEAYNQVYELDEVKGGGRIDPLSGFPNHGERARSPKDAGLKMSPIDRAEARANALRKREDPEATKRANRIQSRFIGPTKRGLSRAIDASSAAKANEKRRLTQSEDVDTRRASKEMLDRLNASREGHMAQDGPNKPAYDAKQRLLKKAHKKRTKISEEQEEGRRARRRKPSKSVEQLKAEISARDEAKAQRAAERAAARRPLTPGERYEQEKSARKDKSGGFSQHRMTGSGGHGSEYRVSSRFREEFVVNYLLDEGFASDEKSAEAIMGAMSEAWVESIVERKHPIMSVTSASGENRSKKRPGATVDSDSHEHENPDQIERRRFSQQLSDRKNKRESEMAAGRLTVATKRGIEKATNRSNDGPGGDEFAPGSALRRREEDDQPTDYRARRRRASGR